MNSKYRWSVGAILFSILVIAGFFGGYVRGYQMGRDTWVKLPIFTKTYQLQPIVFNHVTFQRQMNPDEIDNGISRADFLPFISKMQKMVMPHVWTNDPNTKIEIMVPNMSIAISGNAALHDAIDRFLAVEQLEAEKRIVDYRDPNWIY